MLKATKYNNKKVYFDNILFDSIKECEYYKKLKLRLYAKDIFDLKLQPRYLIHGGFIDNSGNRHKPIYYKADFEYTDKYNQKIVVDVKGYKTDIYRIKNKMFLKQFKNLLFMEA